ncbi:hypothetical protein ACN20G_33640 (plasmid) [Streptomyces sp. BI20]|uniref:hypothetical protein n=1 Tax=Streptomyces sp. BI20 TaxID=3403460 RepID=UPI003C7797D1
MPTDTTTPLDLDDHLAIEQYGHPVAELTAERYRAQDVLRERTRPRRNRPATPARTPKADPLAAHHRRVLLAAISDWTYTPRPTS